MVELLFKEIKNFNYEFSSNGMIDTYDEFVKSVNLGVTKKEIIVTLGYDFSLLNLKSGIVDIKSIEGFLNNDL